MNYNEQLKIAEIVPTFTAKDNTAIIKQELRNNVVHKTFNQNSGSLTPIVSTLIPMQGSAESTSAKDRSIGVAIRTGLILLISLPIAYGIVRITLGVGDAAWILLLWGLLSIAAALWINNMDYSYSVNGIEKDKISTTESIAKELIEREYNLREKMIRLLE